MGDRPTPLFTVLLPVHRGPDLLPFALRSVLDQQRDDFELLVICDGAPPDTARCARDFAAADARITVFDLPKGERNGEAHRDAVLREARGLLVAQIADDDLWFPDHLDELARLLDHCDFGNLTQTEVRPDGRLVPCTADLGHQPTVERMLRERFNFFGPTAAGYRLSAYRGLAERWSPAPREIWTDLYMWRKFLRQPGLRFATRHAITSLSLASPLRQACSTEERRRENGHYAGLLTTAAGRSALRAAAMGDIARRAAAGDLATMGQHRPGFLRHALDRLRRTPRR